MKRNYFIVGLIMLLFFMGCATAIETKLPQANVTNVDLSKNNYRIVKADVVGLSRGINLFFGFIKLSPPKYFLALRDLYKKAGIEEGKAQALINILEEKSTVDLLLFSIPKIRIRADVIEFTD